ncbi:MAG: AMP-binding protein, partial [Wenzhouxiangella sp.]
MRRSPTEPLIVTDDRRLTAGEFLAQAQALTDRLPPAAYLINLCGDRHAFSVAFAAALISGRTNLLPGNRLAETVRSLIDAYPDCVAVSEEVIEGLECPQVQVGDCLNVRERIDSIPAIPGEQVAAVVFTSGSTGTASAIAKPWRTFHDSSRVNVTETGLDRDRICAVATVPPQHMWGLETSVLAPWFSSMVMADGQPFFAADVIAALEKLDRPRALISTPVHLRALIESGHAMPQVDLVLSATAPLSRRLAKRLEHDTGGRVIE